jgi:hypothetical protein
MAGGDSVSEISEKDFQPTRQPSGFFIFGQEVFQRGMGRRGWGTSETGRGSEQQELEEKSGTRIHYRGPEK